MVLYFIVIDLFVFKYLSIFMYLSILKTNRKELIERENTGGREMKEQSPRKGGG